MEGRVLGGGRRVVVDAKLLLECTPWRVKEVVVGHSAAAGATGSRYGFSFSAAQLSLWTYCSTIPGGDQEILE